MSLVFNQPVPTGQRPKTMMVCAACGEEAERGRHEDCPEREEYEAFNRMVSDTLGKSKAHPPAQANCTVCNQTFPHGVSHQCDPRLLAEYQRTAARAAVRNLPHKAVKVERILDCGCSVPQDHSGPHENCENEPMKAKAAADRERLRAMLRSAGVKLDD